MDAIEEVSINVTPYDVRQSGFIGSAINAVTRSGNNNFSGSAYTYFRNQNQQGNKVGDNTFTRQDLKYNQYGFRLGGPIIKNKLFFFVNAETEKQITLALRKLRLLLHYRSLKAIHKYQGLQRQNWIKLALI
ncbi:MAG: hypothetical protein R2822_17905 [Spirosomataceae bacterium]